MLSLRSKQTLKSQLKKSCCKQVQIKECDPSLRIGEAYQMTFEKE